jgi:hypothetical protein
LGCFSAAGVRKHGGGELSAFPRHPPAGKYFFGWICLLLFPSIFFGALVKRLSVRGTQKRDHKFSRAVRQKMFPPVDFLLLRFWAFLD